MVYDVVYIVYIYVYIYVCIYIIYQMETSEIVINMVHCHI